MANHKTSKKYYATETTDRMKLCQINARNIKIFRQYSKAHAYACRLAAIQLRAGEYDNGDIQSDVWLDDTQKIFSCSQGNSETAPALAFITRLSIS